MWKKIVIIILIVIILGGGYFYIRGKNSTRTAGSKPVMVKMVEAVPETMVTKVSADGIVRAREEREVKVRLSGLIKKIDVEEGDYLEKGAELLSLDDEELKDLLEEARLSLAEAEKNYQILFDTYKRQDSLHRLKINDSEHKLEIALLSLEKEETAINKEESNARERLQKAEDELKKARKRLEENRYLYENDAIPFNTLEEIEESYHEAEREYEKAEEELGVLIEETIPNALRLAHLKVKDARNQLELLKASLEKDRITEDDLEMEQIKIKKVRMEIREIEKNLRKITAVAPFSGTVVSLDVEIGQMVNSGMTVAHMAKVDNPLVEAMVDEVDINQIATGQMVKLSSDAFDGKLQGRVEWIAPVGKKVGNINKYRTRVEVCDTDAPDQLKPGMFVNSEIITNKADSVIAVPPLAVQGDEEKYVFIVADGIAEKRSVELGLNSLSKVEIKGVKPGEKIITGPFSVFKQLKSGMQVAGVGEGVK